jgi:hypothetical protein
MAYVNYIQHLMAAIYTMVAKFLLRVWDEIVFWYPFVLITAEIVFLAYFPKLGI